MVVCFGKAETYVGVFRPDSAWTTVPSFNDFNGWLVDMANGWMVAWVWQILSAFVNTRPRFLAVKDGT